MDQENQQDTPDTEEYNDNPSWMIHANLVTAVVFVVLGLVIIYLSWNMPRLEARRIHPMTIPGLVPILLGGAITFCGGLLLADSLKTLKTTTATWADLGRIFTGMVFVRVATLCALVLIYTLGLVGQMPFWLATTIFLTAAIVVFEVYLSDRPRPLLKSLPWAVLQGVIIGIAVSVMFENGFLVRLP